MGRRPGAPSRVPARRHRSAVCRGRGPVIALAALASAALVVRFGEVVLAILGDGVVDVPAALTRVAMTLVVGVVALPALIGLDHSLVRRRLA